ncbi:hypothetical protein [Viridibacillus sp. FSL H8-0123]|uniref:hypothetical protein n=1 Tax=Viridibacillus sp. FSL H8-0123 TaxID=1928922 RepID=UPI00096EBD0B|nr:hypothetical protein [Viridibacillus sp. FSL H8-0123]OMC80929.1 hypothetical protein BK130_16535 [Viridibacillus sp. FSL H8-0123]
MLIRRFIWSALIICVLYVIIHQFLLQIPANGDWQYNLGMLVQALSLSYIAAFLFFIVHNYYPYLSTKKKYQPVIDRELNDLWEICKDLTTNMSTHSNVRVTDFESEKLKLSVAKLFRNLPVNLKDDVNGENLDSKDTTGQKVYPFPRDEEFDEKNKPLKIRGLNFDKWSEAIEYVNSNISRTLNKVLKLKDVVEEETILKIFDMEKSIADFGMIAKIYEGSNNKTFANEYLEQQFIKFYEGIEELRKYNKRYKDPSKYKY